MKTCIHLTKQCIRDSVRDTSRIQQISQQKYCKYLFLTSRKTSGKKNEIANNDILIKYNSKKHIYLNTDKHNTILK